MRKTREFVNQKRTTQKIVRKIIGIDCPVRKSSFCPNTTQKGGTHYGTAFDFRSKTGNHPPTGVRIVTNSSAADG
jgi:hypothetical protein